MKSKTLFPLTLGFVSGLLVVLIGESIFKLQESKIEKSTLSQASHFTQENGSRTDVSFSLRPEKRKPYPKRFVYTKVQEALGQRTLVKRIEKLVEVLERISAEDMNAAIDLIQKIPNGYERELLGQLALLQMAQESPAEALQKIKSLDDERRDDSELKKGIMTFWSQKEPEKAKFFLEKALENSKDEGDTALISALSETWASRDPEKALSYILSKGYERSKAIESVGKSWAKQDLEAATDYALQKLEGEARMDFLKGVVRSWGEENLQTAFQWAQDLPASFEGRDQIIGLVFESWGLFDPQSAVEMVEKLPQGKEREMMVLALAESWVSKDAKQAVQWLEKQPEGNQFTYFEVARRWALNDLEAAQNWLQTLPPTQLRDGAIELFVGQMARMWLPEGGHMALANLATTINNEVVRLKSVQSIVIDWKEEDREAAEAWINSVDLSEEQRATLLGK